MEKYNEQNYRSLLAYFKDVQIVTKTNPSFIVEKIRDLAEFLIFAEKYGLSHYFDMLIEDNTLQEDFSRFLSFNNKQINIQIIQTISILV